MTFTISAWVGGLYDAAEERGGFCGIVAAMREGESEESISDLIYLASKCLSPTRTDINDTNSDGKLRSRVSVLKGGALNTSGDRMKMHAVLVVMRAMSQPCGLRIICDSEYVIAAFTDWRVKTNQDLVRRFKELSRGFNITWEHGKGHALNAACDEIAASRLSPR